MSREIIVANTDAAYENLFMKSALVAVLTMWNEGCARSLTVIFGALKFTDNR